jgi:hypothetical protein
MWLHRRATDHGNTEGKAHLTSSGYRVHARG